MNISGQSRSSLDLSSQLNRLSSAVPSPMISPTSPFTLNSPCLEPEFIGLGTNLQTYSSMNAHQNGNSNNNKMNTNTFVHKLYNMVIDKKHQHLICWNYTGTSFIVANIVEFASEVLPIHFKHNNFSSFVRQLNMYGFHKVNRSPRGHRASSENQIWEFSHPKFLRGRPDLLFDIKRKALDADSLRRDAGDLQGIVSMMQVAQSDMLQQLTVLQDNFNEVVRELGETRRRQALQQQMIKDLTEFVSQHHGSVPPELSFEHYEIKQEVARPSTLGHFESGAASGPGHPLPFEFGSTAESCEKFAPSSADALHLQINDAPKANQNHLQWEQLAHGFHQSFASISGTGGEMHSAAEGTDVMEEGGGGGGGGGSGGDEGKVKQGHVASAANGLLEHAVFSFPHDTSNNT
ncbi:uncharacterized protein VTP21DRAFT_9953 [Calcarisporiella thermophila]|uniref:uncharacterized protein n=1 Tax=Calcarisporiella thermophila TaxID=911321 RepID=UPI003741F010